MTYETYYWSSNSSCSAAACCPPKQGEQPQAGEDNPFGPFEGAGQDRGAVSGGDAAGQGQAPVAGGAGDPGSVEQQQQCVCLTTETHRCLQAKELMCTLSSAMENPYWDLCQNLHADLSIRQNTRYHSNNFPKKLHREPYLSYIHRWNFR